MEELTRQRLCGTSTFLANGFAMGVWSVEIAGVQVVTETSDFAIGVGLLVFAITALAAMQVSGKVVARYPVNYVCAGLALPFSLALTALGLVGGMIGLVIALAVFGITHGALDVAMNARASMIENRAKRPLMSSFHAAWSIGGAVGAGLAGLMTVYGQGPAMILPVAAIIALPGLLLAVGGHQPPRPVEKDGLGKGKRRSDSRRLSLLCLIAFLALLTEGGLANWSSIYLKGVLTGLSGGFAIGYVAFSGGMSIGRLSGDSIVARFGRRRVGVAGATLAAIAFAIVLAVPTYTTAFICFALIGIGMSNVVPVTFGIVGRVARSEAAGISRAASSGYAGFVVGPPLIGGLASVMTLPIALTIMILATALIAILGLYAYRPEPHSEASLERASQG